MTTGTPDKYLATIWKPFEHTGLELNANGFLSTNYNSRWVLLKGNF